MVCINHILSIHLSLSGPLVCFHLLAIVNIAAVNIGVPISMFKSLLIILILHIISLRLKKAKVNWSSHINCKQWGQNQSWFLTQVGGVGCSPVREEYMLGDCSAGLHRYVLVDKHMYHQPLPLLPGRSLGTPRCPCLHDAVTKEVTPDPTGAPRTLHLMTMSMLIDLVYTTQCLIFWIAPLSVHGAMVFCGDETACQCNGVYVWQRWGPLELLQKELESLEKIGDIEGNKKPELLTKMQASV